MARDGKVKLNHKGIAAVLKSQAIRSVVTAKAEKVLAAAIADPHDDTFDYEAGLEIRQDTTDRAVTRVVATDWKSAILEAKYGILNRALDAAK
jgi:hypothetical protein